MVLGILAGMNKYTAYSAGSASSEVLNKLPHTLRALMGMSELDVTKMSGFYGFLFLYIEVAAAIHAVLLGNSIIAKEERDKTTEFLITKPVSRTVIITQKFLAAFVNIFILNIVTLVSSEVFVSYYNNGKSITNVIVNFMLSMFLVQLIFMTLGGFFAAILKKPKLSGSIASSILLASFVISEITNLTDKLDALNILSPFKYFKYSNIVNGKGLDVAIACLAVLLACVFFALTYYNYQKRDLKI
jgi:ABC-2 type transport system permease protein